MSSFNKDMSIFNRAVLLFKVFKKVQTNQDNGDYYEAL